MAAATRSRLTSVNGRRERSTLNVNSRKWGDGPAYVVGALIFIFFYSLVVGDWGEE
jgi:hypothetical protein